MYTGSKGKNKVQFGSLLNGKPKSENPFKDLLFTEMNKAFNFKMRFYMLITVPIVSVASLIVLIFVLSFYSGSIPTWDDIGIVYAVTIIVNVISAILLIQQVSSCYFVFNNLVEDEAKELVEDLTTAQFDRGLNTLLFKRHLIIYVGSPAGSGLHIVRLSDILFIHKQKEYTLGRVALIEVLFDMPRNEAIIIHLSTGRRICFGYSSEMKMRERQNALITELIYRNSSILVGNTSENRKEYHRICKQQHERTPGANC